MFNISNNGIITLIRGDSFTVPLFINRGTVFHPVRYYIADNPNAAVLYNRNCFSDELYDKEAEEADLEL